MSKRRIYLASSWRNPLQPSVLDALLPSGRSAHIEAGYFVGARKPLHILLTTEQEPELMYLMATSISRNVAELATWIRIGPRVES